MTSQDNGSDLTQAVPVCDVPNCDMQTLPIRRPGRRCAGPQHHAGAQQTTVALLCGRPAGEPFRPTVTR